MWYPEKFEGLDTANIVVYFHRNTVNQFYSLVEYCYQASPTIIILMGVAIYKNSFEVPGYYYFVNGNKIENIVVGAELISINVGDFISGVPDIPDTPYFLTHKSEDIGFPSGDLYV